MSTKILNLAVFVPPTDSSLPASLALERVKQAAIAEIDKLDERRLAQLLKSAKTVD